MGMAQAAQDVALRGSETCSKWNNKCPPDMTLKAKNLRGGCRNSLASDLVCRRGPRGPGA